MESKRCAKSKKMAGGKGIIAESRHDSVPFKAFLIYLMLKLHP